MALRLVPIGDFPAEPVPWAESLPDARAEEIARILRDGDLPVPGMKTWLALLAERDELLARIRYLEQKLADRRVISEAVCHLMYRQGLAERSAYRLLQKRSMDQRQPLRVVAEEVLRALGTDGEIVRPTPGR